MKIYRKIISTLLCSFAFAAAFSAVTGAAAPKDVQNHWSKQYVEYGVEKGYINGYEDGSFRPDNTVTRAEFSKMINNAVGISASENTEFYDVDNGDWFYSEVKKAVYAGYVGGYEDGSFKPNNVISRQEAAVIIDRLGLPTDEKADMDKFADADDISDWAYDSVSAVAAKGYIGGDESSRFLPSSGLTRAQAAKILYLFLENENIHNGDAVVNGGSSTYAETLFTDNLIIEGDADAEQLGVILDNCRVLGKITVSGKNVKAELSGTAARTIEARDASDAEIELSNSADVQNLYVYSPISVKGGCSNVYLDGEELYSGVVVLNGDFDSVNVGKSVILKASGEIKKLNVTSKVNLVVQSGEIDELSVISAAAGSVITLANGVNVDSASVYAKVSFEGSGTIDSAYNGVSGITYQTKPSKLTGKDTSDESSAASGYLNAPTVTPSSAKTGVSTSTSVVVQYDNAVYTADGESLTSSYIKNHVSLRKTSATGTAVSVSVTLNSSKKFTVAPASELSAGVKYYLVIEEGAFADADGNTNSRFTSYFTTSADGSAASDSNVTFSPASGKSGVELDTEIKLTFSKAMYRPNGNALTSAYLASAAIELRKGGTNGVKVDFTAEISSTKKTITIKPEQNLDSNTKYYIIILANTLADSDGNTLAKTTSYFSTSNSLLAEISPENASTGVSTFPEITISFGEAVTRASGTSVTSSYLMGTVLELRKSTSTGTPVDFTATISSDKKTITMTPDEELAKSTKYYVIVNDGTLKGSSGGALNEKTTAYFTTAASMAPIVEPASKKSGVSTSTDIKVSFSDALYTTSSSATRKPITAEYIAENEVVVLRKNTAAGTKIDCDIKVSSDYRTITLTPKSELIADLKYYIVVKNKSLYNESGKYNSASSTYFTTAEILAPEFSPADGEDGVDVSSKLEVIFDEPVYRANMSALTASYVASNVIELYKGGEDGELVDFSVTLSADKQTFIIKPDDDLEGETDYSIVVVAGSLKNGDETENPRAVATFTTDTSVNTDVTFEPENKATGVSTLTDVKITFSSKLYRYGGGSVSTAYASEYIQLRKGSTNGTLVETDLAISSDGKTFTLTPKEPLAVNTTYYVKVTASKFQYVDDTKVASKSIYFKTGDGTPVLSKFSLVSSGAASAVFNVLSDTAGTLHMTATASSGASTVTQSASVSAGTAKTVTLSGLSPNTKYTVKAYVETASGINSATLTQTISTTGAFDMTVGETTDTSVTVIANAYADGKLTLTYTNVATGVTKTKTTNIVISAGSKKEIVISGLEPDTQYDITAKFVCSDSGDTVVDTMSILTEKASEYLSVQSIIVSDENGNEYEAEINGTEALAVIERTGTVKVKVVTPGGAVSLKINSKVSEPGIYSSGITMTSDEKVIPIELTYNGTTVKYNLTVTIA